eukprot:6172769-Pleurochrysis_carterae.AAC.2
MSAECARVAYDQRFCVLCFLIRRRLPWRAGELLTSYQIDRVDARASGRVTMPAESCVHSARFYALQ